MSVTIVFLRLFAVALFLCGTTVNAVEVASARIDVEPRQQDSQPASIRLTLALESPAPVNVLIRYETRIVESRWKTQSLVVGKEVQVSGTGQTVALDFAVPGGRLPNPGEGSLSVHWLREDTAKWVPAEFRQGWNSAVPQLAASTVLRPVITSTKVTSVVNPFSGKPRVFSVTARGKFPHACSVGLALNPGFTDFQEKAPPSSRVDDRELAASSTILWDSLSKATNQQLRVSHVILRCTDGKSVPVALAPLTEPLLVNATDLEPVYGETQFSIPDPVVVAGAGEEITLRYVSKGSGLAAGIESIRTGPPGAVLTHRASGFGERNVRLYIPTKTSPADYQTALCSQWRPDTCATWTIRVTEEATRARIDRSKAESGSELAEDSSASPSLIDGKVLAHSPGPDDATFRTEVLLRRIRLMMVIDTSGSMTPSLDLLRTSVPRFARQFLDNRDEVGIVEFSSNARLTHPLSSDWGVDYAELVDAIGSLTTQHGGLTNYSSALEMAIAELGRHRDAPQTPVDADTVNVIFLFTDGLPNITHASSDPVVDEQAAMTHALKLTAELRKGKLKPHVIALGLSPTAKGLDWFFSKLVNQPGTPGFTADEPEGMFAIATSASELKPHFQSIRKRILAWATASGLNP